MRMNQLLLLLHSPAKQTKRKEPLMGYSQFHLVINVKYLAIMRKKVMEKAVLEVIRKHVVRKGKKIGLKNLQLTSL
jgi:hypothetical protein